MPVIADLAAAAPLTPPPPLTRLDLTRLADLPPGLLDTRASDLHRLFPGPLLLHLPGQRRPELFVSVLLHGNEDVGWVALQQVLRHALAHGRQELPRAMTVLVGNVSAARHGLRRLDGQPDYNRVWPGGESALGTPEQALMAEVHARMRERAAADGGALFAAIDLHNNTGLNPHYGIVNHLDAASLHLARMFARTVVLFRGVPGTQTAAFAPLCPAVAVECGKPGVPANEAAAARFLDACLHLAEFPAHPLRESDIDLYHTVALVKVREDVRFAFVGEDDDPASAAADLLLDARLDHLNFRELEAGAAFGHTRHPMPLDVRDEAGTDVAAACFRTEQGRLRLALPLMPAMLTLDERVVRQDCLCYLMERVPFERVQAAGAA
ncbi:M14 family metallopeptidase [Sphaerotilus microaerophilus]|uniref:Succinylglutamate desuccinylase/Aspartoacylase catalytic domain-containing protein n=1 Tax=Sphaerotilus microaerophilus TaxID=2914710 RepID=A0ABN6PR09_9BURK|nr:M14 family metallopeptidase [Sphaerotilus sp. FB-5]BDI07626.1 hypothetical protein CATMQ487_45960 [Sphaerotilus sp. FB-5]